MTPQNELPHVQCFAHHGSVPNHAFSDHCVCGKPWPHPMGLGWLWFSFCSAHRDSQPDCEACAAGRWVSKEEHDADSKLFREDYAEWFRQHNNGREPDDNAWATWRQLTREERET